MGATIKDIAAKLNISTAAVSKALNDKADISDALKERVKKIAEEMGYSPNYFAKKLATNRSTLIGVFILGRDKLSNSEHFGFSFLDGIIEQANLNDYDVILFSDTANKSYKRLCEEKRVEGAIFIGLKLNDKYIEDIKNIEVPVSIIDLYVRGKNINYISSDNEKGVEKALDHLYNLGHRKIAIIAGEQNSQIGDIRLNKYIEYLKEKNIFNPDLVVNGDFTRESGYKKAKELISKKEKPTAIFAISDLMAIGAIQALKENKLKVPENISVIGFDNIKACEYITPKLSTIGQNAIKIGKEAVNAILEKINSKKTEKKVLIEPELIKRETCKKI